MSQPIDAVFVYGTLQRGEVRERCWPRQPLRIEWATIRGQLRDLGEYPALVAGDETVLGELWILAAEDMETTLCVLDAIECYGQADVDLYVRETVTCHMLGGGTRPAFTYRYAQPSEIARSPIVLPDAEGFCHWTRRERKVGVL